MISTPRSVKDHGHAPVAGGTASCRQSPCHHCPVTRASLEFFFLCFSEKSRPCLRIIGLVGSIFCWAHQDSRLTHRFGVACFVAIHGRLCYVGYSPSNGGRRWQVNRNCPRPRIFRIVDARPTDGGLVRLLGPGDGMMAVPSLARAPSPVTTASAECFATPEHYRGPDFVDEHLNRRHSLQSRRWLRPGPALPSNFKSGVGPDRFDRMADRWSGHRRLWQLRCAGGVFRCQRAFPSRTRGPDSWRYQ